MGESRSVKLKEYRLHPGSVKKYNTFHSLFKMFCFGYIYVFVFYSHVDEFANPILFLTLLLFCFVLVLKAAFSGFLTFGIYG